MFDFHEIPGYPYAIFAGFPLRTIRDGRLEPLGADGYPHGQLWAYERYAVATDGTVYGFGQDVHHRVYRMRPGEDQFTVLPVKGYRAVHYDVQSDRLFLRYDGRPLQEWSESGGETLSSLAGVDYGLNDILPQYFEALEGYLSFSDERLYWRSETGGDWQRVRLGWFDRHVPDDIWTLEPRRSYVDAASGLFALQFSNDVLVFDARGGAPEFLYAVRDVDRVFHVGDGPIVAVIGGLLLDDKRTRHTVQVIGRDGPRLVQPDDAVVGAQVERLNVPWNGVSATGYVLPPLFRIDDTWMFFDGARFVAAPALGRDETGLYPRWTQWGKRLFLLDQRGWWEVQRDLTLTPGALPLRYRVPLDVELEVSEIFGAVFAGRREQGLWVSRDGLEFAQVDTGDVPVREYATDLPAGGEGVVLADDGLYLIDGVCVEGAVR